MKQSELVNIFTIVISYSPFHVGHLPVVGNRWQDTIWVLLLPVWILGAQNVTAFIAAVWLRSEEKGVSGHPK